MLQATRFLLDLHAHLLAEKTLQKYETQIQGSDKAPPLPVKLDHLICQGRLYMELEDYARAEECFQEAIMKERPRTSRISPKLDTEKPGEQSVFTVEMWTCLAHSQYMLKKQAEAIHSYTSVLHIRDNPLDNTVYLRLGELLIKEGSPESLEKAKQIYLKAAISYPTSSAWLGIGIACYMRQQYAQCEEALVEAYLLDIDNGVAWGYICLVCMQLKRDEEADRALHLALRRGIDKPEVLREIGFVYVAAGKPAIAEEALREALKMQEDATVRRALADSLAAQNDIEAAVSEYKIVLQTFENEDDRKHALGQLKTLLVLINRPAESNKFGKQLAA